MNVVGARPQFVKAGPVSKVLAAAGITEILVHTGQHYDDLMADAIMTDVGLREPDHNLGVGSGSHGTQTARMLEGIESLILDLRPDAVLSYGDTNSTVAAALASTKQHVFTAHVEAGLRSHNRTMPEELNRIATDHLSDLLLAPTAHAMTQLREEGLQDRSVNVGDVMVDALNSVDLSRAPSPDWANGSFWVATVHRAGNTDDPDRLRSILEALNGLNQHVYLLAHPRLVSRIEQHAIKVGEGSLVITDPLPYSVMLRVLSESDGILTDSGGLQKEAFILQIPCTTLRSETEWPETLVGGWNVLAGTRLNELPHLLERKPATVEDHPFGDGAAAHRIVSEVTAHIT